MDWALNYMPVVKRILDDYKKSKPLAGMRVVTAMRVDAKMGNFARALKAAGALVYVASSSPQAVEDDIAAGLYNEGINVFAQSNATQEMYKKQLMKAVECNPNVIVDTNGDLMTLLHNECKANSKEIIGGCEETTTGIRRAQARARAGKLDYPIIASSNAKCQALFDDRYGTGQSVWSSIMSVSNLMLAGKNVVVAGYGWCGRGVALRAMGLGANVIVCEVDPVKALEASMDGCTVMVMDRAARLGDVFVTVTGCKDVIKEEHFEMMKDGALLTNAGHFDVEINVCELDKLSVDKSVIGDKLETYVMKDGKKLNLVGEGRLVNLVVGEGGAAEALDLGFAIQAKCAVYIAQNYEKLKKEVYTIPKEIDYDVARIKLNSRNIKIDELTDSQAAYLKSWEE
ncbi:MAG: adenosylhomocysteinase [Clostridia bacterium]|nr:adenosylhomocysteinase [Clostridia bacterium]